MILMECFFLCSQLRLVNDEIRFNLIPVITENVTVSSSVKFPPYNTSWHAVELNYTKGELSILVDYRNKQTKMFALAFELGDKVIIGSGITNPGKASFVQKEKKEKKLA